MRADIHGGPEQKLQSEAGYIDARPQTDSSTKTSCNARPDHTYRVKRRGVDGQSPVGVKHLDRAEILRGGGMIEQDQMPDRFADVLDLGDHHVARDRPQPQVVKLNFRADVGVDAGRQVLERLALQFFLAMSHVEHDAGSY